jgi:hypothetical protein|tara:strand:+ start:438 stop:1088 length:651 start_codon:yes stop_codon:yes gene_type:complete
MKKIDIWESYNNLLLSDDISRIRKTLARYELFKKSMNIPGDIVECGVFKGVSFMFWLKCLKIFSSNSSKKVIGFDTFSEFSKNLEEKEKISAKKYIKESDFKGINPADLSKTAKKVLSNRFELVMGEIEKTSKKYISKNYGFKISLLHLDLDTYSGTKSSLINFFPKVSKGGIIILDEYGNRGWGETDAVDEFLEGKNYKVNLLDNTDSPTGYIVK